MTQRGYRLMMIVAFFSLIGVLAFGVLNPEIFAPAEPADDHTHEPGEPDDHTHDDAEATAEAMDHEHDTGIESQAIAAAMELGDAENGKELFNKMTSTGFACATCHHVDTMETLVGPGLLGVGDIGHDHSMHTANAEATAEAGMNMDAEATAEAEMDMDVDQGIERVEYIRTSILNPGAFVVPGFVDNLMPQNFAEIFTEQEINDLVAYLLTLKHEE